MQFVRLLFALFMFTVYVAVSAMENEATLEPYVNEFPYVDKEFVIVKSTPDFEEARQSAVAAAERLGLPLDLRGVSPDEQLGLTFPEQQCMEDHFGYPCYVARGRWDDGAYVSIEWSNRYRYFSENPGDEKPFAQGLYIVMVANGDPGSADTTHALTIARRVYPDAYAKRAKVYVGCIH